MNRFPLATISVVNKISPHIGIAHGQFDSMSKPSDFYSLAGFTLKKLKNQLDMLFHIIYYRNIRYQRENDIYMVMELF